MVLGPPGVARWGHRKHVGVLVGGYHVEARLQAGDVGAAGGGRALLLRAAALVERRDGRQRLLDAPDRDRLEAEAADEPAVVDLAQLADGPRRARPRPGASCPPARRGPRATAADRAPAGSRSRGSPGPSARTRTSWAAE
jgi:hypothetical protein